MTKHESQQLWAVVCTRLHTSFGPFRSQETAQAFAERMDEFGRDRAIENGSDPRIACRYVTIPLWIEAVVDYSAGGDVLALGTGSDPNKPRLN